MTSTADLRNQPATRTREMRDLVRGEAAESERQRTLTPTIVDEMWAGGLMSSFNPLPAGGLEKVAIVAAQIWLGIIEDQPGL